MFQIAISTDDVYKSAEVVNLVTQELGGKITRQPGPIPGLNTKITSFLDPDGWKTVSSSTTLKIYDVKSASGIPLKFLEITILEIYIGSYLCKHMLKGMIPISKVGGN